MAQPITDPKLRADLSYEVQQALTTSIDFLRVLKDTKDGLLPDSGPGQTGTRANRAAETVWSVYDDILRSTAHLVMANNLDKESLVALLRGADPTSVPSAPPLTIGAE